MIEIAFTVALSMIVVALSLRLYGFPILVIGSLFIGIAFSVCVVFVCIPGMMAALEAYQSENPDALHAYAMIVGSFGLIGAAYYLWDCYRKESGVPRCGASPARFDEAVKGPPRHAGFQRF